MRAAIHRRLLEGTPALILNPNINPEHQPRTSTPNINPEHQQGTTTMTNRSHSLPTIDEALLAGVPGGRDGGNRDTKTTIGPGGRLYTSTETVRTDAEMRNGRIDRACNKMWPTDQAKAGECILQLTK
jgi:hypothetical protein